MRWAVSGLVLAAAFECLANPVLIGEGEELFAAPQGEDRLPDIVARSDRRLTESDPLTPPPAPQTDEIRGDEAVPGRRLGFDDTATSRLGATAGLPGNYGNAFGQGDTLREPVVARLRQPECESGGRASHGPGTGAPGRRNGIRSRRIESPQPR